MRRHRFCHIKTFYNNLMKVIFLDIDGVLQPLSSEKRFRHMEELECRCAELEKAHPPYRYSDIAHNGCGGNFDIAAVCHDWNPAAVERLRRLLNTTGARIVISSDWREKGIEAMRALMAIHELDTYVDDTTLYTSSYLHDYLKPFAPACCKESEAGETCHHALLPRDKAICEMFTYLSEIIKEDYNALPGAGGIFFHRHRATEIREYLDRHPEITAYAVIDDLFVGNGMYDHLVQTQNFISLEDYAQGLDILKNEDGPYPLPAATDRIRLAEWRRKIGV